MATALKRKPPKPLNWEIDRSVQAWFNSASKFPPLPDEDIRGMALDIQNKSIKARNKLVEHNLLLIPYFLRNRSQLIKKAKKRGLDFEDLLQEGAIGLLTAADKYNGSSAFGTYAAYWVREAIHSAIDKKGRIRVPKEARERFEDMGIAFEIAETGDNEILKTRRIPPKRRKHILEMVQRLKNESYKELLKKRFTGYEQGFQAVDGVVSLDQEFENNSGKTMTLQISYPENEEEMLTEMEKSEIAEALEEVYKSFPKEHRVILERRILADEPLTYRELGKMLGLVHGSVQYIEARMLERLKQNPRFIKVICDLDIAPPAVIADFKRKSTTKQNTIEYNDRWWKTDKDIHKLTEKEERVCTLVSQGKSHAEIVAELKIGRSAIWSLLRSASFKKGDFPKDARPALILEYYVPNGFKSVIHFLIKAEPHEIIAVYRRAFGCVDKEKIALILLQEAKGLMTKIISNSRRWYWTRENSDSIYIISCSKMDVLKVLLDKAAKIRSGAVDSVA
ncbi:MAG: sigma-70 family RNA polymerase sigma factor [Candidatus Micrarchaeia archaeon]